MNDSEDETFLQLSTVESIATDAVDSEESTLMAGMKAQDVSSTPGAHTQEVSDSPMVIDETVKPPQLLNQADIKMEVDTDDEKPIVPQSASPKAKKPSKKRLRLEDRASDDPKRRRSNRSTSVQRSIGAINYLELSDTDSSESEGDCRILTQKDGEKVARDLK